MSKNRTVISYQLSDIRKKPQGKNGFEFIQAIIIIALVMMLYRAQTSKVSQPIDISVSESAAVARAAVGSFSEFLPPEAVGTRQNPLCGLSLTQSGIFSTEQLDGALDKIWFIESSRRLNPPAGDGGLAAGPLQLHQCVLDDVNEFYGTNFTPANRLDFAASKQIASLYITMWFEKNKEEIAVRIFNGGPRGWRSESTDKYWAKYKSTEKK